MGRRLALPTGLSRTGVFVSSQPHAAVASQRQYRFGDFTLDLDAGFLRDAAHHEIPLRPKAFEALVYLVERHGRLVTKAELLDWLWSDAAVTDNSLAQCLLEIRRAIGDDSHRVIRTVARRGYVFAAPVSSSPVAIGRTASLTTGPPAARESGPVSRPALRAWIVGGAVIAALLVAIGGARVWRAASGPKLLLYTQ